MIPVHWQKPAVEFCVYPTQLFAAATAAKLLKLCAHARTSGFWASSSGARFAKLWLSHPTDPANAAQIAVTVLAKKEARLMCSVRTAVLLAGATRCSAQLVQVCQETAVGILTDSAESDGRQSYSTLSVPTLICWTIPL